MPLKLLILIIVIGGPLVPTFWSILDIPKRRFADRKKKIIWFLVVSTLPFIGGMLYIIFVRRHTQPLDIQ